MPRAKIKPPEPIPTTERWTVVQVAAFLSLSYQTARNNMLSGDYGPSDYEPKTRCLTVDGAAVIAARAKVVRKRARKTSGKLSVL